MKCRHCKNELTKVFVDLVNCPPSNDMLKPGQLNEPEVFYPLKIYTCDNCLLVQVDEMRKADSIFNSEYTYFSSYSTSWLAHAKKYADMMVERFGFNSKSQVIEIASNDGYLLQYFKEHGVPVLGVDPTANTASVAISKGIPTIVDFFGAGFAQKQLVDKNIKADLILGNNVLAHVPDINDFVKGVKIALKPAGVVTFEFPHLLRLVEECQFDTIYHEHFSYLSFTVVKRIFESQGLTMFDVQELPTHGGSLRIFAKNADDNTKEISPNVAALLKKEEEAGIKTMKYYDGFQPRVDEIKYHVWEFLVQAHRQGKKVIGYGAAAKGNTLLNYCGIKGTDLIQFVVDASPHKQNLMLPASHIPVKGLDSIAEYKPDYVIILPWNLKKEIGEQLKYIRDWGGKFVTFIPELNVF
jgi:2-polyprenyl-3-methyl-5-hydroxy-6-metoxy-1,4-benzoquinol methylase